MLGQNAHCSFWSFYSLEILEFLFRMNGVHIDEMTHMLLHFLGSLLLFSKFLSHKFLSFTCRNVHGTTGSQTNVSSYAWTGIESGPKLASDSTETQKQVLLLTDVNMHYHLHYTLGETFILFCDEV